MTGLFHGRIVDLPKSRKKRHKCGPKEYFDEVVQKCSLCKDVCEAKIRLGLKCQECKGYVSQSFAAHNDIVEGTGGIIFLPVAVLVVLIIIVLVLIMVVATKLYRQKKSSSYREDPVEEDGINNKPVVDGKYFELDQDQESNVFQKVFDESPTLLRQYEPHSAYANINTERSNIYTQLTLKNLTQI